MFLGQFALGVDHLRLDPDAEFQPFAVCVRSDVVDAFGELPDIDLPVAESGVRIVARIFVAEPSVVQHEHFQSHEMCIRDRAYRALHLPEGDSESLCYDLFGHCRCVSIGKDRKLS